MLYRCKDASVLTHCAQNNSSRFRGALTRARSLCALASLCLVVAIRASALAQLDLPEPPRGAPIAFGADRAHRWERGAYEVWWLEGNCFVHQGPAMARGDQAVLWVKRGGSFEAPEHLVIAYFEGNVSVRNDDPGSKFAMKDATWLGEFNSTASVEARTPTPKPEPATKPSVYLNGVARREPKFSSIQRTQFTDFSGALPAPQPAPGARRIRVQPRSETGFQARTIPNPVTNETVAVVTQGVNIIVDGLPGEFGTIDVSADRIVIWTTGLSDQNLNVEQDATRPLEVYAEGNIEMHQGERVVYAQSLYYNVPREQGTILNAEMLTPAPRKPGQPPAFEGLVRLKADVLRQVNNSQFFGQNMFMTTSRLAEPGYRVQSSEIQFEDVQTLDFNPFTGAPALDPVTGEQLVTSEKLATSTNNFVFLGPVPVFYWPTLATDLEDPVYYIRKAQIKNDRIFGTQLLTQFDMYQILGIRNEPEGTDWGLNLDYMSDRGFGHGTTFSYNRGDFFNLVDGPTNGFIDLWGISEQGLDNLGSDRMALVPEEDYRHRIFARHRQRFENDWQLTAELGLISDRNFLEQYYENEWDNFKDESTGLELKHTADNRSFAIAGDARINDFFTETQGARLDHYMLGQPLLGDWLSWYEHSTAGYADLKVASTPTDPVDAAKFQLMPWEVESEGERLITRQELDLPLQLGPLKIVPYALGEAGHWGEAINGEPIDRLYGQAGVRGSIPFWTATSDIESSLFNVHGIAHKVVFDVDAYIADANEDLGDFPLYDQLDDNAQEHFRRRLLFNTFGGVLPPQFDERFYALRSGMASAVTAPSFEIADDLAAVRGGIRQRWQTKRGLPGQRRIIDWIVLDTNAVYFPDAERDNFGENIGLADFDFRWHIGDRTTLVSTGLFDFFPDGQEIVTIGAFLDRPPRANLYLGFHSLQGPIDSQVVIASYSYKLSPKWLSTAGASYDMSGTGNIGQNFSLTRVGESLVFSMGFNVDESKDNVGVNFMLQPRFLPLSGVPLAGLQGLE